MTAKQKQQITAYLRTSDYTVRYGNGNLWVTVKGISCYFYFDANDTLIDVIVD